MGNNLLFVKENLALEMRKFGAQLEKKQQDFEIAVSSLRHFEEDYKELEKWLNEKEAQYDRLLTHAHLSSDIDKIIDSCKVDFFFFFFFNLQSKSGETTFIIHKKHLKIKSYKVSKIVSLKI